MNPHNDRIVFMGTPEFAVASLEALLNAACNVVAVVTAPDKPAGRGMQLQQSAVKQFAVSKNIPILQPEKLKAQEFLDTLRGYNTALQVVVAFRMLPEVVWNMPPMGSINLHGSLLPQYRGAAPINWAVMNGETTTGVTTFKLQHAIDTGDILLQETMAIGENETAGEVHDRMKLMGAGVLVQTVKGLFAGTLTEKPQASFPDTELKHAPKIFTDTCRIDWSQSLDHIHNQVRGLSPFPGAFTSFQEKTLKIFRTEKEYAIPVEARGSFVTDQKNWLKVACTGGYLHIKQLQLEGKKRMDTADFLRGLRW